MTRFRSILAFLLLFSGAAIGQQVKWGPFTAQKGDYVLFSNLSLGEGENYLLKRSQRSFLGVAPKSEDWLIQKIEPSLALSVAKEMLPKNAGVDLTIEFGLAAKGKLLVFASLKDKKTKTKTLYSQEWDPKLGQFKGTPVKVIETQYSQFYNPLDFFIRKSQNGGNILVYAMDQNKNNEPISYRFVVMNPDLKPLWSGTHMLPVKERDYKVLSLGVSNDGIVYVESKEYEDRKAGKFLYQLSIHAQNNEVRDFSFETGDKQLHGLSLDFKHAEYIRGIAFFSASGNDELEGTALLELDRASMKLKPIVYSSLAGKINGADESYKMSNLIVCDWEKMIDGSQILVAEKRTESDVAGTGAESTGPVYHFMEAIAVRISPEGKLMWVVRIPKHQKVGGLGLGYSSAQIITKGDDAYLFYNDDVSNLDLPLDASFRKYEFNIHNLGLIAAKVDGAGLVTRKVVVNPKDVRGFSVVRQMIPLGNDQYQLVAKDLGKGETFGILSW